VRPTQPVEIFGNVFSPVSIHWLSVDFPGTFYGDRPRVTPSTPSSVGGGVKRKRVAKYSDFLAIEGHTLETVQDRR